MRTLCELSITLAVVLRLLLPILQALLASGVSHMQLVCDVVIAQYVCNKLKHTPALAHHHCCCCWLSRMCTQVDTRLTDVEAASRYADGSNDSDDDSDSTVAAPHTLLAAVQRCNKHDMRGYMPVYIENSQVSEALS
jgi:hypothetical protein